MSILPPVPNCSKAVRFFLLFLPKIKQRLKIFPDFHTEGETSAWRLANGGRAVERSYYLEKSASARFSINLAALPSSSHEAVRGGTS